MDLVSNRDDSRAPVAEAAVPIWAAGMAVAPILAALLDAWQPFPRAGALWLDFAALSLVAVLAIRDRGAHAERWRTPFDGRVVAVLVVTVVQALSPGPEGFGIAWLRQTITCGVLYYGLVAAFRGAPRALDAAWLAFAAAAVLLGGHALLAVTTGLSSLARDAAAADLRWASQHGLARALLLATLFTGARAAERGAAPGWRVAAVVGATGTALHLFAGGLGLTSAALARLDDPLYFSASCVLLLLLFELARHAWNAHRTRESEAQRWRLLAVGFTALAFMTVFGATLGGEGVRVLAATAGALVVVAGEKPAAAESRRDEEAPALSRAA